MAKQIFNKTRTVFDNELGTVERSLVIFCSQREKTTITAYAIDTRKKTETQGGLTRTTQRQFNVCKRFPTVMSCMDRALKFYKFK